MMNAVHLRVRHDLGAPLDELIHDHGLARVSLALLRAALHRGQTRPPPVEDLPPHLLRDIGLEPRIRGTRPYVGHLR